MTKNVHVTQALISNSCDEGSIPAQDKAHFKRFFFIFYQVIEEPVKKWQNVSGANTLVR